jgi:hypothetical protein
MMKLFEWFVVRVDTIVVGSRCQSVHLENHGSVTNELTLGSSKTADSRSSSQDIHHLFYVTRMFITMFTRARHWTLS